MTSDFNFSRFICRFRCLDLLRLIYRFISALSTFHNKVYLSTSIESKRLTLYNQHEDVKWQLLFHLCHSRTITLQLCCVSSSLDLFVRYRGTFRDITALWFPQKFSFKGFSCDTISLYGTSTRLSLGLYR